MKKQKKCYIYTRVSTSMQVDGYSVDAQKDKFKKYADVRKYLLRWPDSCIRQNPGERQSKPNVS